MREPAGRGEPGAVVGSITVTWRGFSDTLDRVPIFGGLLARQARKIQEQVGNPDPATEMGEIRIDLDKAVAGRPISVRTSRAEVRPLHWVLHGGPADWWARVVVFRDGVPLPTQFPRS